MRIIGVILSVILFLMGAILFAMGVWQAIKSIKLFKSDKIEAIGAAEESFLFVCFSAIDIALWYCIFNVL